MAFCSEQQRLAWVFSLDNYHLYCVTDFRENFSSIWIHQKFGQGKLLLVYLTLFRFIFMVQVQKYLEFQII